MGTRDEIAKSVGNKSVCFLVVGCPLTLSQSAVILCLPPDSCYLMFSFIFPFYRLLYMLSRVVAWEGENRP